MQHTHVCIMTEANDSTHLVAVKGVRRPVHSQLYAWLHSRLSESHLHVARRHQLELVVPDDMNEVYTEHFDSDLEQLRSSLLET